jgi:G3E family GTPase
MTIATQVITGFLGAGKTTLISALLALKPANERWAIIVNEFGQIGIDQVAWAKSGVWLREVPGGCICCTQNLPLQIALGQVIAEPGITRLLIEPTGLGHPSELLQMLREPHWQAYLKPAATLCAIDARQLGEPRLTEHEVFNAQIDVADVLVFTKADVLSDDAREQAIALAEQRQKPLQFAQPGQVALAWLDAPLKTPVTVRRSLLHLRPTASAQAVELPPQTPPFHYHEQRQGQAVGGWIFPPSWQFQHDPLLTILLSWRVAERVKGVFHTDQGWVFFNATGQDLSIKSSEYRADSRVEIISLSELDWPELEQALLACRVISESGLAAATAEQA